MMVIATWKDLTTLIADFTHYQSTVFSSGALLERLPCQLSWQ